MKKLLFAAVLATVAIGGAVSTSNALTVYTLGSSKPIRCSAGNATCTIATGGVTVYRTPASSGPQTQIVPLSQYEDLQFIPN